MARVRLSRPALFFTLALLSACGGDDGGTGIEPVRVTSVIVTPSSATSDAWGETVTFQAQARDADGNAVSATVSWSSSDPSVATVASSGQVATVGDGTTTITATANLASQGVSSSAAGTATLTVAQTAVGIVLSSSSVVVARGDSETLTAAVVDAEGTEVPGRTVTWTSGDESVVTVSAGVITGVAEGSTTVQAASGEFSATADVTVVGPPADTVVLTPAADTLPIGDTLRFTATVLAVGGDILVADSMRWTSADEAVASVDSLGTVSALAVGSTTIQVVAFAGMASATSSAEVVVIEAAPDFEPQTDTTLSGDVDVTDLTVPSGVTVTLSGATTVSARGAVSIAGTLTAACAPVAVEAQGRVTITGTVSNACGTPPAEGDSADFTVVSSTGFTVDGATITSGGKVSLRSEGAVSSSPHVAPSALRSPGWFGQAEEGDLQCFLLNAHVTAGNGQNFKDEKQTYGEGLKGRYGGDVEAHCGRDRLVMSGTVLEAGDGGSGENAYSLDAETVAKGGDGQEGGRIFLTSDVAVHFTTLRGSSALVAGSGGEGGNAVAEGWPEATALGGNGGPGGDIGVEVPDAGGVIYIETSEGLQIGLGSGGAGGTAVAEGLLGENATSGEPAKKGGDAFATGGAGGNTLPFTPAKLVGDVLVGPVNTVGKVIVSPGEGGDGGSAMAHGGSGGAGSQEFPEGGTGGDINATGGEGGKMVLENNGGTLWGGGLPGWGGLATFDFGRGGPGFDGCSVNPWVAGGAGGQGGDASGADGKGGTSQTGEAQSPHGGVEITGAANGGLGGDGDGPGAGGPPGADGVIENGARNESSSFDPGNAGDQCSGETSMAPSWGVNNDPGGHDPYIGYRALVSLTLLQFTATTFAMTGLAPWVALNGTLNAQDLLTLAGVGTVAGYPNIHVLMVVALTRTALGVIAGFTGTVTVGDQGGLPGGYATVYDITAEATGGGSFKVEVRDARTGESVDPATLGLDRLKWEAPGSLR